MCTSFPVYDNNSTYLKIAMLFTGGDNFSDVTKMPQITPGMGPTNPRLTPSVVNNNESLKQVCDNSFGTENKVTSGSD